jgi:DNA-binding response OmpR family regulator
MNRRVLIIDDERDLCRLLAHYLTRRNYQVECAHTLDDGLKKLHESQPDVLLLDNNLPDGLGWSVAPKIHEDFPALDITLMSAQATMPLPKTAQFPYKLMEKPLSLGRLESFL